MVKFLNTTDKFVSHFVKKTLVVSVLSSVVLLMGGCNEEFQPIQENDKYYFSMYGFLDASADTQKIRISPARDSFETPAIIPEFDITIEHHNTGEMIPMFPILEFVPGGNAVLNAWTPLKIEPSSSYTIEAKRPDGMRSWVTIDIPDDFPTPVFIEDRSVTRPRMNRVIVQGVDNIADFYTRWYVRLSNKEVETFTFHYRNEAEYTSGYNEAYVVRFSEELERKDIEQSLATSNVDVLHRQIFIATAGSDWIEDIEEMDDLEYALPEGINNVEDGLGYVIGIVSKLIPYRACEDKFGNSTGCPEEKPFR